MYFNLRRHFARPSALAHLFTIDAVFAPLLAHTAPAVCQRCRGSSTEGLSEVMDGWRSIASVCELTLKISHGNSYHTTRILLTLSSAHTFTQLACATFRSNALMLSSNSCPTVAVTSVTTSLSRSTKMP